MLKFVSLIGSIILISFSAVAAETVYSSVLDDLPLMQGMTERPEDTVIFDNPGGRIVEFSAQTTASAADVRDFYQHTLPPLGWKSTQPAKFVRDKEALKMDFDKSNGETIVHFALTPANGGK